MVDERTLVTDILGDTHKAIGKRGGKLVFAEADAEAAAAKAAAAKAAEAKAAEAKAKPLESSAAGL